MSLTIYQSQLSITRAAQQTYWPWIIWRDGRCRGKITLINSPIVPQGAVINVTRTVTSNTLETEVQVCLTLRRDDVTTPACWGWLKIEVKGEVRWLAQPDREWVRAVAIAHCVLLTVYCTLCIAHCVLHTVYCTLCIAHCVLHTVYCTLCIAYRSGSNIYPLHSAIDTQ